MWWTNTIKSDWLVNAALWKCHPWITRILLWHFPCLHSFLKAFFDFIAIISIQSILSGFDCYRIRNISKLFNAIPLGRSDCAWRNCNIRLLHAMFQKPIRILHHKHLIDLWKFDDDNKKTLQLFLGHSSRTPFPHTRCTQIRCQKSWRFQLSTTTDIIKDNPWLKCNEKDSLYRKSMKRSHWNIEHYTCWYDHGGLTKWYNRETI